MVGDNSGSVVAGGSAAMAQRAAHIECRSENAEANPPFEVELADVVRLYIVKGWIARDVT